MLDVLGNLERTHTCGELRENDVGKQVVLMGWVAKKRDFGVFTFIDLRDRDGVTQVVLNEEDAGGGACEGEEPARRVCHRGKGRGRSSVEGTHNAKLATGDIEVHASEILILNDAKVPPFQLEVAGQRKSCGRIYAAQISLSRPSPPAAAAQHPHACEGCRGDPRVFRRPRLYRDRDADPAQIDA